MQSNSHIRFLGAIVFICSLATGSALIADGQESLPSFFGGILLISYTLLHFDLYHFIKLFHLYHQNLVSDYQILLSLKITRSLKNLF